MKTYQRLRYYLKSFSFHITVRLLCLILLFSTGISCKEKQKPPDFKKDTSSTVLFKKEKPARSVVVERIARSSFQRFIISTGIVAPGTMFPVKSLLAGRVKSLAVEEGQDIKSGQIICELDQTQLLLDLQHQAAVVGYQKERLRNPQDGESLPTTEVSELALLLQTEEARQKLLENRLDGVRIKSPIAGQIQQIFVQPGEVISQGAHIADVIDLSQVTIRTDVHQDDLPYLKRGMRVEVYLNQDPSQVFLGEVVRVALEADPSTHRFGLDVSLINLKGTFLPGMEVQVKIRGPFMKNVLLIPKSAIRKHNGKYNVFVVKDSYAEFREVTLGPQSEGKWIVHSGIKEGEQLIIFQIPHLVDGEPVEISPPQ